MEKLAGGAGTLLKTQGRNKKQPSRRKELAPKITNGWGGEPTQSFYLLYPLSKKHSQIYHVPKNNWRQQSP